MTSSEGVLSARPQLKPLASLSPSRYVAAKRCALNAVWAAGQQSALLPVSPSARLGTVIHTLLEEAGSGKIDPDDKVALDTHWNTLVARIEREMSASWLERHLVPLRSSVPDFEVRRMRACGRAVEISQEVVRAAMSFQPGREARDVGEELRVRTDDGVVAGRIDRVVATPDGPVLQDYKSGQVEEGGASGVIKEAYVTQLQLYAALYTVTTSTWPIRLELVPLQGAPIEVSLDQNKCTELLEDARTMVREINQVLASCHAGQSKAEQEAELTLATPSPGACRYCPYRPACKAYELARNMPQPQSTNSWPSDVLGIVESVRVLGNSKTAIVLNVPDSSGSRYRIVGLNSNPARHPALEKARNGDKLGAYNLLPQGSGATYTEAPLSALYLFPALSS